MKVYVASPLGFSAPGRLWSDEVLHPLLEKAGIEILDPWADQGDLGTGLAMPAGDERVRSLFAASRDLAQKNFAMVRAADAVLAVLDGTDVDSGTATEMGYACALGTPVVGLRTDFRQAGDHDGVNVNLQVEECIHAHGGILTDDAEVAVRAVAALGEQAS